LRAEHGREQHRRIAKIATARASEVDDEEDDPFIFMMHSF
jgi:hypothetical protein